MAHTPDGGPAHGGTRTEQITHIDGSQTWADITYYGLTIRDYMAAKALPAIVAEFMEDGSAWDSYDDVADSAYLIADAMIRRREQKPAQSPREAQDAHIAEFGDKR